MSKATGPKSGVKATGPKSKAEQARALAQAAAPEISVSERTINGFVCENADKFHRAIHGTVASRGIAAGGVGENASPEAQLAEYDRLGGLITKDGRKVKTGSFYNFETQEAHKSPEPVLVLRDLNGTEIEVPVGGAIPVEVQAAEIQADKVKNAPKGRTAAKGKAKASIEDEE